MITVIPYCDLIRQVGSEDTVDCGPSVFICPKYTEITTAVTSVFSTAKSLVQDEVHPIYYIARVWINCIASRRNVLLREDRYSK